VGIGLPHLAQQSISVTSANPYTALMNPITVYDLSHGAINDDHDPGVSARYFEGVINLH
tara:strand:+ start:909 stop:1085 length:177 start_codon:yes stop_codon:yes gene_type:complete